MVIRYSMNKYRSSQQVLGSVIQVTIEKRGQSKSRQITDGAYNYH